MSQIAYKASEARRISPDIMYKFYLKRISICLQTAVATAINCRVHKIMGYEEFRNDRTFQDSVIVEQDTFLGI